MKKTASTLVITAVLITAIVVALALCARYGYNYLDTYLNTPHSFESIEFTPYGHSQDGLLTHRWDSLQIVTQGNTIMIRDANVDIALLDSNRHIDLQTGEISADIQTGQNAKKDESPPKDSIFKFPDKVKFYLPTSIAVQKLSVSLDSSKHWEAENISIQSNGVAEVNLKADSIKGDYVQQTSNLTTNVSFKDSTVKVQGKIVAGKDSIDLNVSSPKNNLAAVKTKLKLNVAKPTQWLPFKIPKGVPGIGKLDVQTEASLDPKTGKPNYDLTIKTTIGEFWPLKPLNALIKIKGNSEKFHTDVTLKNNEGGTITLHADMDKNLNGTATGKVENMSAMFGPQMMPLDLTINSAEKTGNKMNVSVTTRQGSNVNALIDFDSKEPVTYEGDISPFEPWALDWCKGRLTLKDRFKVYGTVVSGGTQIFVKIPNVEYAYHVKADSLQTKLFINKYGIDFTEGIIFTPKETFDFTGDVIWGRKDHHTSWNVTQRSGGKASAYITIMDSTTIDVTANKVELSTIPFADIKINEKLKGKVSGHWRQNFDTNVGEADVSIAGNFDPFSIEAQVRARENGDTIFIDKAEAIQSKNKVQLEGVFVLPNDSNPEFRTTGPLPVQVLHAWIASDKFNIPLLLDPVNDSTLKSGFINGDLAYDQDLGLQGNIDFTDIEFSNIPSHAFNIKKMNLFAEASKIELNAYLGIGGGGWSGNTQIILDNIFQEKRHVSISHSTDNGGDMWAEGFIDTSFTFKGKMNMNGTWFVPGTFSEIKRTDVSVDLVANLRDGLNGITADITSDSTFYQPPKINYQFPIRLRGHLEQGLLDISEVSTQNDSAETIAATVKFDLKQMQLQAIDISSTKYTLRTRNHKIVVENVSGHMEDTQDNMTISANIPTIKYNFDHESFGNAEALGHSNLNFIIPHSKDGLLENKTISGDITIDKLVYKKDLDIEVTPSSMSKLLAMFNGFVAKLRKTEVVESKISTASPINLALHISDTQKDSVEILTSFAEFPLTFDIMVLGNTNRPLLRGDFSNSNNGFIGVKDLYQFDLNYFRISWSDVPWQHGVIDVSSNQELPYCNDTENRENETCPINLDIQGTITNPQPTPSSNCGNESSAAAIYYNIFLGCIAENTDENTDWNKLAGKAIGKVLSTTANKTLGGEYIGDIDMKVMFFNSNTSSEKDSSYFKLPVSLDRWVKDLSFIFGYTQDQSENPTYDQALQFGINYTLPVFREPEFSHKNHLSPTLSLNAQLISKQYLTNTGTEGNENRIEKNIGLNYNYRFWNPCLLGIGKCETLPPPQELQEQSTTGGEK